MGYKAILHVIGLILAFNIRKVKISPLNDSKYSAIIMYCSCIFLILAITVIFGVPGINGKAASWTVLVYIEVCIFLGLTFIPKVRVRYIYIGISTVPYYTKTKYKVSSVAQV